MAGDLAGPDPVPRSASDAFPERSTGPGSPIERLRLVSFERNLWEVGIAELEETVGEITLERIRSWFGLDACVLEAALLRTCQRVVLVGVFSRAEGPELWTRRLSSIGSWTVRADGEAIRHLCEISAGLESRAPGEREIREQVRSAARNVLSRSPRRILANLLERAARAPEGLPAVPSSSVADLAADWLRPRLADRRAEVVVIGAGTVGRRAAERLSDTADVTVLYRSRPPDPAWTSRWGIRARPTEEMREALARSDAVIAAAKSSGRVLGAADLPTSSRGGPRWFVDLGLPRNVDPAIGLRPGTQLVDLAGLPPGRLANERLAPLRREVNAAAEAATREFVAASVEPWISELRGWAESIRAEEWARASEFAGSVPGPALLAFERFSERLVRRLLAGPTQEMRSLPPGPEMDVLRRRVVEMFYANDARP